jgi:hypothetical protein
MDEARRQPWSKVAFWILMRMQKPAAQETSFRQVTILAAAGVL